MKRYASCYCRYSSDKQQQQSIEYQLERIEEFCQKHDITLIEKYIDEATTGTNDQRSDFQRMIQDSEHSKWGYLLVYNLSRLARNVEDQMFYQKILKQRGIMIISVEEKFDSSPEGHLFALITAGINEYYSKHLAKRSFAGVMQNAKKGLATGGVPPLGFGFRVGFLGLLHMEIFQERLDREFNQNVIATAPSVNYRVAMNDKSVIDIDNPAMLPDLGRVHHIEEPYVKATIITPSEYVGNIMELCQRKRGTFKDMQYISTNRVELIYDIPLSEIIFDFFDKLKSSTKGYASLDYELSGYKESKLVKLDILLNSEPVNALAMIVHQEFAYERGSKMCSRLKKLIPKQLFEIPVQAAIGSKVIARSNIKAMRKDVLAKCYGGDISRKKKLLEKQKEGKKRMKSVGTVEIPQEAFMSVLSLDDED